MNEPSESLVIKMVNNKETRKLIMVATIIIILTISLGIYALVRHEFMFNFKDLVFSILALVVKFMNIIGVF